MWLRCMKVTEYGLDKDSNKLFPTQTISTFSIRSTLKKTAMLQSITHTTILFNVPEKDVFRYIVWQSRMPKILRCSTAFILILQFAYKILIFDIKISDILTHNRLYSGQWFYIDWAVDSRVSTKAEAVFQITNFSFCFKTAKHQGVMLWKSSMSHSYTHCLFAYKKHYSPWKGSCSTHRGQKKKHLLPISSSLPSSTWCASFL